MYSCLHFLMTTVKKHHLLREQVMTYLAMTLDQQAKHVRKMCTNYRTMPFILQETILPKVFLGRKVQMFICSCNALHV